MTLARIVSGWGVVLAVFLLWWVLEHKAQSRPEPIGRRLRGELPTLAIEAGLLTLLCGLWFASLGSGGGWLVFLLLGLLIELPQALRARAGTGQPVPWIPLAGRVGRIVVAALAGGLVLAR